MVGMGWPACSRSPPLPPPLPRGCFWLAREGAGGGEEVVLVAVEVVMVAVEMLMVAVEVVAATVEVPRWWRKINLSATSLHSIFSPWLLSVL